MRSLRPEGAIWTELEEADTHEDVLHVTTPHHEDPDATQKISVETLREAHRRTSGAAHEASLGLVPPAQDGHLQRRVQVVAETGEATLPVEVAALLEQQASVISERILCHDLTEQALSGQRELRFGSGRGGGGGLHGSAARSCVIGVTSAVAGEGKTTVAMHVATAVAQNSYKRVCLLDLGLGDDDICRRLNLPTDETTGLSDLVEASDSHEAAAVIGLLRMVRLPGLDNLVVVPGGRAPKRPARAAHSPWLPEVIAALRERFDIIIVDLPSVGSGNALPMLPLMSGVVMVVGAGVTPREVVDEALDRVGRANVLGAVLNGTKSHLPDWLLNRVKA